MTARNIERSNVIDVSGTSNESLLTKYQNKDCWLCWRYEQDDDAEKPRKVPVDLNTFRKVDATDSAVWTDYNSVHTSNGQANSDVTGLGIALEFGDLAGIDLDNCRDPETGDTEDWAIDIVETLDSYAEVSPSGTGLHVLVKGALPEDARNRQKDVPSTLSRFDEAEIEIYDSVRYFTFTGDHIEDTPTSIKSRPSELLDIHDEYVDEEDDKSESLVPEPEADLNLNDEDLIKKAKNAENGDSFERLWDGDTSAYNNDHSRADMALMQHLAYWTQCNPTRMERLFSHSGLGQRDKWRDRDDYRNRTIQKAIDNCHEVYRPQNEDGVNNGAKRVESGPSLVKRDEGYFKKRRDEDGEVCYEMVSNFHLEVNAYLVDENGSEQVDLTVRPCLCTENEYETVVPFTVFNETRKFRQEVVTGRTTIFEGGIRELNALRQIVAIQEAPTRYATEKIGIQDGEIVTPQGILGVENPTFRYVEQGTALERKYNLDTIGDYDEDEVARILELLPEIRRKERGLLVLGWWYGSLFAPQIRNEEGELPALTITGEAGAGKTALLQLLSQLFGLSPEPASPKTTRFSLIRHMSATTNIPVWFDEYKPSEMAKYEQDNFHDLFRKHTRGIEITRGQKDQSEKSYSLTAPIVLSGEQQIQGNAEQRRAIRVRLKKVHEETKQEWSELIGESAEISQEVVHFEGHDYSQHARAVWELLTEIDDDEFKKTWQSGKESVYKTLSQAGKTDLEPLERVSLTMVKFGLAVFQLLSSQVDADPDITDEDIEKAMEYVMRESGQQERTSHVEEFLQLAESAARAGEIDEGVHYSVVSSRGADNDELCLRLPDVHGEVSRYLRERDINADFFDSHKDYRERLRELSDKGRLVTETSKVHRDLNRCVAFDLEQLDEELSDFEADMFTSS
jgi:primase-polymerase (primpol)-like protein/tRNA A37 threonylcarbamoyladenosine biosynthesis protein TsaE